MSSSCNFSASMTMAITSSDAVCNEATLIPHLFPKEKKRVLVYKNGPNKFNNNLGSSWEFNSLGSDLDRTNLHEPNIYFIACPAVANFLVGIVICPLTLYEHFEKCGISSIHLCRFWNWIDVVETVSIYTLTFISFDRYLKISKPFKYNSLTEEVG